MCGIVGILNHAERDKVSPHLMQKMVDSIYHRGPDDEGIYCRGQIGLGMRRLSIIDIDSGQQPIFNEDGTIAIVFNGEIYNHQEIQQELEKKGYVFRSHSDTESILHLYEHVGPRCVDQLRGMFAFAIWDGRQKRLFLARDRVGIKPLYFHVNSHTLTFASELKAILQNPEITREIDLAALDSYFALSYVTGKRSIFQGIEKLLPGHYLIWENGKIQISQYWDLVYSPIQHPNVKNLQEEFLDLLRESIRLHLVSDVPVGAFLSGGIDSSTIVALMTEFMTESPNTFTIGFGGTTGSFEDERPFAQDVAQRYQTTHFDLEVQPQLEGLIEKIVGAFDEPFADDSSIPSYFVSELAARHVKVVLSGLGGDELFGGYERQLGFSLSERYQKLPGWFREKVLSPFVGMIPEMRGGGELVNRLKRFVGSSDLPPEERYFGYQALLGKMERMVLFSQDIQDQFDSESVEADYANYYLTAKANDPMDRIMYQDVKVYLPDDILTNTDRLSMAHSLEARVPFLDHKLMEFCATIPSNLKVRGFQKKYFFRQVVESLLPQSILNKKKQGFVGPMSMWLRHDLKEFVRDTLSEAELKTHGFFSHNMVNRILDDHFARRQSHDTLIWALISFQVWHHMYMKKSLVGV